MKSFIDTFTSLYNALAKDICAWCPSLIPEMDRDLSRLHSSIKSDGFSFITITHGKIEKAFLRALSGECDLRTAAQLVRGMGAKDGIEDCRPRYLHGLWSLIFTNQGTLLPNVDPDAILFLRQWLSMAKKVEIDCTRERHDAALRDWIQVDNSLPDHHPGTWDHNDPIWSRRRGHPLFGEEHGQATSKDLFGEINTRSDWSYSWNPFWELCATITGSLGIFDPYGIRPKHGPGQVADREYGVKYDFKSWPDKLQSIFPWDFFATADLGEYKREFGREPNSREFPCVMYAVPKTQDTPRLIAAESVAHQWIQGGIQRWFEERVDATCLSRFINFRDQVKSQNLARMGSLLHHVATVDLSAASDRVSTRLVEYVFQSNPGLLDALHACRSRLMKLPDGSLHRMRKFAPMGSAVCFPVQTIVFTVCAIASIAYARGISPREAIEQAEGCVQVFGDDIIVPIDSYPALLSLLHELGLKVNENKSFHTGSFREACGMDAFEGYDVTPVRVKKVYRESDPSTLQSVVTASNNLFMRGFWQTSAALLNTVPEVERKLLPIGVQVGGAVSLVSFVRGWTPSRKRWDPDLHHWTTRALTMSSRHVKVRSDGDAGLIQFFHEEPDPESKYDSGQVVRSSIRSRKRARHVPVD